MTQLFGYISGILAILAFAPYIRDIFRRTTKPERASWFIWLVLGGIALATQYAKGATDSLWLTVAQTLAVVVVFGLSIPFGVGGFQRRDIFSLIIAASGLALWFYTREAIYALFIVIFVDAIGVFLTVVKAYEKPETETLIYWATAIFAAVFGMLAVGQWNWILLAYPFYIFINNITVVLAILLGKRRLK